MRLTFSDAVILEGEELEPVRGSLEIENGRIKSVGGAKRGVNLKGAIIMPPFVNAHTHIADYGWKEGYLGRTQPEVVGPAGIKHQVLSKSGTKAGRAVRSALESMLRTGTVFHLDFREGGVRGVRFLRELGIQPLKTMILGRGDTRKELRRVLRIADGIGLPSINTLSEPVIRNIAAVCRQKRKVFALHVDETAEEHERSVEEYGCSELERALKLKPSFVVHATHASTYELELARQAGVPVVFCVRSNFLLGAGIPPLALALEIGVESWIGTDNGMVCEPNMFEELMAAWQCVRRQNPRAGREEALALLQGATGRPISKLVKKSGWIEKGAPATFMVLARGHNLQFLEDLHAGIVNRARAENMAALFVEGKAFYYGKHQEKAKILKTRNG